MVARPIVPCVGSNATFWGDKSVVNRHIERSPTHSPGDKLRARGHTHTRIPSPMEPETARLLRTFFAPYNAELARVLHDERFRWADVV